MKCVKINKSLEIIRDITNLIWFVIKIDYVFKSEVKYLSFFIEDIKMP